MTAGALSAASTDAVNGSQLYATNQAITNINNGTTGLVQQSPAAPSGGPITVGAGTGGTIVNFANSSGGNRVLTGVAAGSTAPTSIDAINGSQLNTAMTSVATDLGGGASYNPVTGQLTAPGYAIDGTTYNNVGDALAALAADSKYVDFNSALAAANATGTNASAIGPNAQAAGNNSTALGVNSNAAGNNSSALGSAADASGTNATALGALSSASGNNATALGNGSAATGTNSVALGSGSQAGTSNAGWTGTTFAGQTMTNAVNANAVVSISGGTTNRQLTGVADGAVNATSTDAVNGAQLFNTATALNTMSTNIGAGLASSLGGGASVSPNGTVTNPTYNVAGGTQNNVGAALGALNTANSLANTGLAAAIGGGAAVAANGAVTAPVVPVNGTNYSNLTDAIAAAGAGFNFTTGATGTGVANGTSVSAIGAGETHTVTAGNNIITTQTGNDVAIALNPALTGLTSIGVTGGPTIDGTGINMNGDKITGLAAGSTASGSTEAVNGGQLNTGLSSVASNLGGGAAFDPATGTVTTVSYSVQGTSYTSVGTALDAVDSNLTNILNGTAGLVQQVGGSPGAGQITVGAATGGTSVSFAGTSGNRQLTDVAAGAITATSDDAITGAQVFANNQAVAALLGGGAGVDPATGALTAPSYAVGGSTVGNVGAAIAALQTGAPVQYSTAGAPTTPNGLVPSQNMTLVGAAAGPVTLSNVGPAALTGASTDAVNGSQINALASSNATIIGGGSAFNPLTGTLTAPTINVGGTGFGNVTAAIEAGDAKTDALGANTALGLGGGSTYDSATGALSAPTYNVAGGTQNDVGSAFVALNAANNSANTGIASTIGGGMAIGPDGAVTNPVFSVNGSTYGTVADAVAAAGSGFNLTTAAAGSGVANGTTLSQVGAGETATVTAGNNIVTTQNGNEVQVALNSDLIGIDSIVLNNGSITGLAAGSTAAGSTDAVNGGQINTGLGSVAAGFGGGSTYDPVSGTVTAPSYLVSGSTYTNVGAAFGGVNTAITKLQNGTSGLVQQVGGAPGAGQITVGAATGGTSISVAGTEGNRVVTGVLAGNLAPASSDAVNGSQVNTLASNLATTIGGGSTFDPVSGTVTTPVINVNGSTYANLTDAIQAAGGGFNLTTAATGTGSAISSSVSQVGAGETATITAGNNIVTTQIGNEVRIALNPVVTGLTSVSVTGGPTIDGNGINMNGDRITGLGAGSTALGSTDAVNGGQFGTGLGSVATNLGGGSTYNTTTGMVTAPTYTVQGNAYNSVGSAFGGVDAAINSLTNGTTGLVQQTGGAPGSGSITIGSGSGGTVVNMAGTAGNRLVTGVAPAALTAASTDAVNGSQVNALASSVAANLGGGAAFNPATGNVSAPSYTVGGTTVNNVGAAITQLQTASPIQYSTAAAPTSANGLIPSQNVTLVGVAAGPVTLDNVAPGSLAAGSTQAVNGGQLNSGLSSVANGLGGGSTYNPATGQISAPSYTVSGATYSNVGAALAASNRNAVQYVPDAAGNPTNAVRLSGNGNGQPVAVSNVAAGAVTATSLDAVNGGQLYAVQQTAAGAVQYDRNSDGSLNLTTVSFGGTPGTPVQLRNVAPAVRATDAVNLGQMQAGLVSTLSSANAYTDGRIAGLAFDLGKVAKHAYAGTASALALQSPALFEPGTTAMRGGVGYYRGEWAMGLSFRATADNGRWSLTGGISGGPNSGVAASAGVDFILGN